MKLYLMTDLEGVAGVLNFQEWTGPGALHYQTARELLTREVNAAVEGFFEGGASEILVCDGHGPGAIDITLLDPRADLLRGWAEGPWPLRLDESFDALAFVGQHAKAGTERAHLCHTQSLHYLDLTINGVSIGEFGQLAMCASELGVRTIFGSGDEAFAKEAQALVPGIETVAVKRGVRAGTGEDLTAEQYERFTAAAIHTHPVRARARIRAGALRAMQRAREEDFGIIPLTPPFERVTKFRPTENQPQKTISTVAHPTSLIAAMNLPDEPVPME
jgi:D-amino peptidase